MNTIKLWLINRIAPRLIRWGVAPRLRIGFLFNVYQFFRSLREVL